MARPGFVFATYFPDWHCPDANGTSIVFAASLHVGTGPQVIEARPDFILDDVRFETF
ncbi:MAG: hypothetical protein OXH85_01745 [Truepera sp.]|nr:hypothetical protein [Truepera sp.]